MKEQERLELAEAPEVEGSMSEPRSPVRIDSNIPNLKRTKMWCKCSEWNAAKNWAKEGVHNANFWTKNFN